MKIQKCDGCGKVLTKAEDYYSISDISFNKGNNKNGVTLVFSDNLNSKSYDMAQSWCSYTDMDFCVECFKKENISKYLK